MNPQHICDSYDFVKRVLLSVRPGEQKFLAVPMFTAPPSRQEEETYQRFLAVDLIDEPYRGSPVGDRERWLLRISAAMRRGSNAVFLDPDTGIRLPRNMPRTQAWNFVGADEIIRLLRPAKDMESLLLCFDQSLDRRNPYANRELKLQYFDRKGVDAIYFTSHASILAASLKQKPPNESALTRWIKKIQEAGVPESRLQKPPLAEAGNPVPLLPE